MWTKTCVLKRIRFIAKRCVSCPWTDRNVAHCLAARLLPANQSKPIGHFLSADLVSSNGHIADLCAIILLNLCMQTITITQIKLDLLRFFKDKSAEWSDTEDEFKNQYEHTEIEETYDWIMNNGWFEKGDDQRGYKLNFKGKSILEQIEGEKERKDKRELEVIEAQINKTWWDRSIDNGQKILNIIFVGIGLLVAILTYNQVQKSNDIKELQERVSKDSLKFSTTLRDLKNQVARHDSMLQSNRETFERLDSVIYSSSLVKNLNVDKQAKKK